MQYDDILRGSILLNVNSEAISNKEKSFDKNISQGCNQVKKAEGKEITKPLQNITVNYEVILHFMKNLYSIKLVFVKNFTKTVLNEWALAEILA